MPDVLELLPALCRGTGLLFTMPFLSGRFIPWQLRIALAALLALAAPAARWSEAPDAQRDGATGTMSAGICLTELLTGAGLGWAACLALSALRAAGVALADQAGLALGGALDGADADSGALRSLFALMGVYTFITLDFHHAFLRVWGHSLQALPVGGWTTGKALEALQRLIVEGGAQLFEAAFVAALPVMCVLLVASLCQGILSRALPEIDFFAFGPALRTGVGLCAVFALLPSLAHISRSLFEGALEETWTTLRTVLP